MNSAAFEWDPPEPGANKLRCRLPINSNGVSVEIAFDVWWHEIAQMHYQLEQARKQKRNPRAWYEKAPG